MTGFVDLINKVGFKNIYRIAKSADIVPLMPPMFLGFRHYNTEIFINSDKGGDGVPLFCYQQPSTDQKGSCSNRDSWIELLGK
jgi:hypothetical protein